MNELQQINAELERLSKAILANAEDFARYNREATEARNDYDVAKAKAQLKATGTVQERAAEALLACEPLMRAARIAETMRDTSKQRGFALSDALSAQQTRAKNLQGEMSLAGRYN